MKVGDRVHEMHEKVGGADLATVIVMRGETFGHQCSRLVKKEKTKREERRRKKERRK